MAMPVSGLDKLAGNEIWGSRQAARSAAWANLHVLEPALHPGHLGVGCPENHLRTRSRRS